MEWLSGEALGSINVVVLPLQGYNVADFHRLPPGGRKV